MIVRRDWRRDLAAAGMTAAVVLLSLSLATYDPADPTISLAPPLDSLYQTDVTVLPLHARPRNACGRWGATVADVLLSAVGAGAWYLTASLAALAVCVWRRRRLDLPLLRWLGWLLSLIGLTMALAAVGRFSMGPAVGPGGYLGTLMRGLVEMRFAQPATIVLGGSFLLAGWFLCASTALWFIARWGTRLSLVGISGVRRLATRSGIAKTTAANVDRRGVSVNRSPRPGKNFSLVTDLEEKSKPAAAAIPADDEEFEDEPPSDTEEDEAEASDESGEAAEGESDEAAGAIRVVRKRRAKATQSGDSAKKRSPREKRKRGADNDHEAVKSELDEAASGEPMEDYELPDIDLLMSGEEVRFEEQEEEVRRKALILEKTFAEFGFTVKVVEIETGPVIAQYEVQLEAGLRLSKITGLSDDLAIALRVPSVRIVAPIPGKNTVGIEVPNEQRQVVRLRDVIEEDNGKAQKMRIPLFLGKDVSGNPLLVDLSTLPHLLIAGRTGTGKSVCLNAIISSILMTRRPDEVRLLMIDPKMVELSGYGRLPHLMHPVVTDMRKAEAILAWAVDKMEERYALLARAGVRHISSYNQLGEEELHERLSPEDDAERQAIPIHLPFIVIVADEIADLMMTAGKEVEQHIIRLAQKSRAVGIHLILATQKPTVNVITGLIKSNLPARIAFQVASRTDSRVVLDEMGADKLLGNGDLLFLWPGTSTLLRGQGTYLSDEEIKSIVDCVSTTEQHFVKELVNIRPEKGAPADLAQMKKRDELYENAVNIVVREGRGSVSLLQRSLGIGYGRAARLIDFMAEDGFVGEYNGSQAREVLMTVADWERMQGIEPEDESPAPAKAAPTAGKPANKPSRPVLRPFDEDSDEDEESDESLEEESDDVADDTDEEEEFDEGDEAESGDEDENLWAEEDEEQAV